MNKENLHKTGLVIKALLLIVTMLYSLIYMSGVDSLTFKGVFVGLGIMIFLILLCVKTISEKDLDEMCPNWFK